MSRSVAPPCRRPCCHKVLFVFAVWAQSGSELLTEAIREDGKAKKKKSDQELRNNKK